MSDFGTMGMLAIPYPNTFCTMCGKCCWDFRGNNWDNERCQYLSTSDSITCTIYSQRSSIRPECINFPKHVRQLIDFPLTCGFISYCVGRGWVTIENGTVRLNR